MPLEPPRTLSPSKVASFTDCALAFRFSAIDRLPEAPTAAATRGTLVHACLERLLDLPPVERTIDRALSCLDDALGVLRHHPEYVGLGLDEAEEAAFLTEATALVHRYFALEDPTTVHPIGLELMLAAEVGGATLRGIIDRLELDDDGGLIVTDYKTGKAPGERYENGKLSGVHVYSLLCERNFGQRPAKVRLLYLGGGAPLEISTVPTEQSTRAVEVRVKAIWQAVERACERDDFRPRPGRLCDWCSFHDFCPAQGGVLPEVATSVVGLGALAHPSAGRVGTAPRPEPLSAAL
ncbi:MAG: PD-(D/E)XK nuclease family protein [Acidimicrobiales bacterium]